MGLKKSTTDKKLAGVCGGLAAQFGIDSTIVRIIFAIATVVGVGSPILIYLVLAFVMPE